MIFKNLLVVNKKLIKPVGLIEVHKVKNPLML